MFKKCFNIKICLIIAIVLFASNLFVDTTYSKEIKKISSKSISLNIEQVTIPICGRVSLESKIKPTNSTDSIKWYTSNKKIATVKKGLVIGISEGTAVITAKTSSGKNDECKVIVTKQWNEDELVELIKINSIDEDTIIDIIDSKISTETSMQILSSELVEDIPPNNNYYYPTTYYTLNQNDFNTMYNNMHTKQLNKTNINCYPNGEFDWLVTDTSAVTGSAINVHISDINASTSLNDFYTISQNENKNKLYTKYTTTVILTGYVQQDFPIINEETIYLSINVMSNNVDINGMSGGTPLNSDGSFFTQLTIYTNSPIDDISFRKAEIYGYRYGY